MRRLDELVDELHNHLLDEIHPGGPGFLEWEDKRRALVYKYMEEAYDLGREKGYDQGHESAVSWMRSND